MRRPGHSVLVGLPYSPVLEWNGMTTPDTSPAMKHRTRVVFFDLYNTLVRFDPPREQVQVRVCAEFGITVDPQEICRAYQAADEFMVKENARRSLATRSEEDTHRFWSEYECILLRGAGSETAPETALQVFLRVRQLGGRFALFDDVLAALSALKARGVKLGVISNLHRDLGQLSSRLGMAEYFDFYVTSQEVGAEKPDPKVFLAGLQKAQARPEEAIHVGDQYHSDVVGAQAAGIRAILVDREGFQQDYNECPRVRSLTEVVEYL